MKWNTGNIAAQSEQLKKRVYNVDVEILEKYEIQTHYYQYLRNAEIESIAISRQFSSLRRIILLHYYNSFISKTPWIDMKTMVKIMSMLID